MNRAWKHILANHGHDSIDGCSMDKVNRDVLGRYVDFNENPLDNQTIDLKADKNNLEMKKLKTGDNPIYIKIVQRNGHIAWSSPIYLNFAPK